MALQAGTRLGPYEVLGTLGAGGMGEVYRARDTRLDRDVALKILPSSFAGDPDRLMRFEREAKTLATLNHPHIAQIHGIEESGTARALVMELVEGETLADRLARGALTVDDALPIARQITEALDAAHDAGIIHRDLKPANIKVRPDGTVKVLDFGLAKPGTTNATDGAGTTGAITSPALTIQGVILGTAAYMAPEQAKGKPVDRRADIWAFGCVFYEMLTGARAFDGEDTTEILGAIVKTEPDWSRLPGATPPRIAALLRRCLQKDSRRRQQHIGDARLEIEDAATTPELQVSEVAGDTRRRYAYIPWAVAGLASIAALVMALRTSSTDAPKPPMMRVDIATPPLMSLGQVADFALSPDGRFIAFLAGLSNAPILVRTLESGEVRPLPGTEGATRLFWSPDSRSVGFFGGGGMLGVGDTLMRIELTGGAPATIARDVGEFPRAATWGRDGTILFDQIGPGTRPLLRVPAAGGQLAPMTALMGGDAAAREGLAHYFPHFLPDGDLFLFTSYAPDGRSELRIGSLSAGTSQGLIHLDRQFGRPLTPLSSGLVQFLPPDRVVYVHEGELRAQRIDVRQKSLVGTPETLAVGVPADATGREAFSVSADGTVAYRTGGLATELAWFDRAGRRVARASEPDAAQMVVGARLSPDGSRIALDRFLSGNRDVWVLDVARGSLTRLTADAAAEGLPVWSPDGQRVAYESMRSGIWNLYLRSASGQGAEERLQESSKGQIPLDWSRDGRFLLYVQGDTAAIVDGDLFALPLTGGTRTPVPIATTRFTENGGRFSPDGRWVAYETNQSGRAEVVVQPFPDASTGAVQVSVQGGSTPRWRADGRELYFMAPDGTLMAADVNGGGTRFEAGVARSLFRSAALNWFGWFQYEVDATGRFLMSVATDATVPIRLLLNWQSR